MFSAIGYGLPSGAAWPSANRALFVPFEVAAPTRVKKLWCYNGATASGNIDVGIYNRDGVRLVSSGSTAQAGTSAIQEFDVTDLDLYPGVYYFAMASDATTTTVVSWGATLMDHQSVGVLQMAAAMPLPATATFASLASAYTPVIGFSGRVLI